MPRKVCSSVTITGPQDDRDRLKQFVEGETPFDLNKVIPMPDIPGLSERCDTRAGSNFKLDLNPGSELRNWLTGLLGKEYFKERSGQQIRLDSLLNTECEVELQHFYGKRYEKPLVVVASIRPVPSSVPTPVKVDTGKTQSLTFNLGTANTKVSRLRATVENIGRRPLTIGA